MILICTPAASASLLAAVALAELHRVDQVCVVVERAQPEPEEVVVQLANFALERLVLPLPPEPPPCVRPILLRHLTAETPPPHTQIR